MTVLVTHYLTTPAHDLGCKEMLALIHAQQQLTVLTAQLAALAAEQHPDDQRMLMKAQPDICCLPLVDDDEEEEESERKQVGARSHNSTAMLGACMAAFTLFGMNLG